MHPSSPPTPLNVPSDSPATGDSDQPLAVESDPSAPASGAQAFLPYAQASPFQRAQGLRSARAILEAAYLFLSPAQWQQALDHLQLPLHVSGGQAAFLPDGLGVLVHYLEAHYRPPSAGGPLSSATPGRLNAALLAEEPTTKHTYSIRNSLVEQLIRVSYWRRQSRTWFINVALAQLLSQYPEASIPLPELEPED